jgi:hypothetical protein
VGAIGVVLSAVIGGLLVSRVIAKQQRDGYAPWIPGHPNLSAALALGVLLSVVVACVLVLVFAT